MAHKILILCSEKKEDGVQSRHAGRLLLWGLRECGIGWDVYYPDGNNVPDLSAYSAILCWSYIHYRTPSYLEGARHLEKQAEKQGIPVINKVLHAARPHSFFLDEWQQHGIRCARCQRFSEFVEIDLEYPLIIRRDGVHKGQDVFLVQTPEEARKLIEERREDDQQSNFNLAVEFLDTCWRDGYYRKRRSYIIGQQILPRHSLLSKHWLVNLANLTANAQSVQEDQAFLRDGEENAAEVLKAARLTGSDIVALDYTQDADGRYVFWEANRHFLMIGDSAGAAVDRFAAATGRNPKDRRKIDEQLGMTMGKMVLQRMV